MRLASHILSTLFLFSLLTPFTRGSETPPAPENSEHTRYDRTLRIAVTKPTEWHFLSGKQQRASRHAVEYENKVLDMYLKRYARSSSIVISKYPEPYRGQNPTVIIDLLPLGEERLSDSLRVSELHYTNMRQFLRGEIEVKQLPVLTEIDGKKFGYYRVAYTLGVEKLPPFNFDQRAWFYSLPLSAVSILALTPQSGDDVSQAEIEAIMASIRFNPRR
ncbi:hypothetical protein [Oleiharenicola lentus]|uniref:hypothetical protein n=1 Tax=Oleiharenicola lentus TaxID=2508720 RepID=UPI003F674E90